MEHRRKRCRFLSFQFSLQGLKGGMCIHNRKFGVRKLGSCNSTGLFRGFFGAFLRHFRGFVGAFPGLFWGFSRAFPGLFQGLFRFLGGFFGLFWSLSRDFSGNLFLPWGTLRLLFYIRLVQVTTGSYRLLQVTKGYYRLLQVTTCYYRLLQGI